MKRPSTRVTALCWRLDVPEGGDSPAPRRGTILVVAELLAIHYQDRWIIGKHLNPERAQSAALEWTKTLEVRYDAKLESGPVTFSLSKEQAAAVQASSSELPPDVLAAMALLLGELGPPAGAGLAG